ncbi:MAG TPA: hypothetical protein PLP17_15405, partial [Oligoflexia bacterium]|nr:hypothetical protein [Oligoflexia bacterium]
WIFEESDPGIEFSFLWTCAYLELEPAELRKRIRQLTISQDVSQAHRWLRTKVQSREAGGAAVCGDSK